MTSEDEINTCYICLQHSNGYLCNGTEICDCNNWVHVECLSKLHVVMRTLCCTICKKNQDTNLRNLRSKYEIPEYELPSTEYENQEYENFLEYDEDEEYPSLDDNTHDDLQYEYLEEPDEYAYDYVIQYINYIRIIRMKKKLENEERKKKEEERREKIKNSRHSQIYSNLYTNTSTDRSDW